MTTVHPDEGTAGALHQALRVPDDPSTRRVTRTLTLPVVLINEKPGLQLLKVPETLQVTVDGPEGDTGIGPVEQDASRIRWGLNYFLVTHNQVKKLQGMRVTTIHPALLTLEGAPR
jgi:hypothetical protein